MAYVDQYAAARDATFMQRLEIALVIAAKDIISEARDVSNHYNRCTLATQVLRDASGWTQFFRDGVAAIGVVQGTSIDTDFYNAVAALWNAYAGVTHNGALTL